MWSSACSPSDSSESSLVRERREPDERQATRWQPLIRPDRGPDGRWTVDAWAPLKAATSTAESGSGSDWPAVHRAMTRTTLSLPKMDCAAEERLVRMTLEGRPGIRPLDADLSPRELTVFHDGDVSEVVALLRPLNLGADVIQTAEGVATADEVQQPTQAQEARTLKIVFAINAAMFAGEIIGALLADSSALLADSLDMFADAAVYGIALFGVHRPDV